MIVYGNPGWGRDTRNIQPAYEPAPVPAPAPKPRKPSGKRGRKRPVIVNGERYQSITSAARALSLETTTLAYALRRGRNVCAGHEIAYAG